MATIRLQNVGKAFGPRAQTYRETGDNTAMPEDPARVYALDGVDLTVPDGQTMAVLGPSGCGKSTLLRVIAGLETDYSGELFYDGQPMRGVPPKDRHIGMVFQNYALYPHFEGYGNLSFFFRVRKAPDEEAEERIRITSEIMGIGFKSLLRRTPGTLSGGQQQRLAVARAIVRQPQVFLFDEPLSNLDAKLRSQTRVEIKRLLRRFGITALYVTHDQTEAMALGDRVAVMRAGKIEQVGPFPDVRARPANAFVAGFLGTPPMNLLADGAVEEGAIRLPGGLSLPLPPGLPVQMRPGQAVTVGIRPEDVAVQVPEAEADAWQGVIEEREVDFGRQVQLVHLRLASGAKVTGQADVRARLAQGERVRIAFDPAALHFFDGETGQRLD